MGSPWGPCVHLAPLRKYGASNVRRTDVDTERKKEERKKKKERVGEGKGKGKDKKEKEKGKERKRKSGRRSGREREREGEGEKRELKKSWTHGRTDTQVILYHRPTLFNAMHCIGQTTRNTFCETRYLSHSHCRVSAFYALTSWCTSARPAYSVGLTS